MESSGGEPEDVIQLARVATNEAKQLVDPRQYPYPAKNDEWHRRTASALQHLRACIALLRGVKTEAAQGAVSQAQAAGQDLVDFRDRIAPVCRRAEQ